MCWNGMYVVWRCLVSVFVYGELYSSPYTLLTQLLQFVGDDLFFPVGFRTPKVSFFYWLPLVGLRNNHFTCWLLDSEGVYLLLWFPLVGVLFCLIGPPRFWSKWVLGNPVLLVLHCLWAAFCTSVSPLCWVCENTVGVNFARDAHEDPDPTRRLDMILYTNDVLGSTQTWFLGSTQTWFLGSTQTWWK